MHISAEYGTELLLRYAEEQKVRDVERQRIVAERLAELGQTPVPLRTRIAALIRSHPERMPSRTSRATGGSQVHAAHR